MIGKRAKILAQAHVEDLLFFAQHTRHPIRNQVIVLLSLKAGLRAAEIANLAWDMVVDPTGEIATTLELRDRVAKRGGPGCLNRISASISGASAEVRLPSGEAAA